MDLQEVGGGGGAIFLSKNFFSRASSSRFFRFALCWNFCLVYNGPPLSLHTTRSSETQLCIPNCKLFRSGQLRQCYETIDIYRTMAFIRVLKNQFGATNQIHYQPQCLLPSDTKRNTTRIREKHHCNYFKFIPRLLTLV